MTEEDQNSSKSWQPIQPNKRSVLLQVAFEKLLSYKKLA